MDPLELAYDTQDTIPEPFRPLYAEKDGKFVLSNVNGVKTQADIDALSEALRKERGDHSAVKQALAPWKSLGDDPTKIQQQLDKIPALEAAAAGGADEEKLKAIVDGRVLQETAPLNRNLQALTGERDTAIQERDALRMQLESRDRNDAVRSAANELKVVSTAIADIELVASAFLEKNEAGNFVVKADAQGVTPGLDVLGFLKEMQKTRPHWWPASNGGGAGGGGGAFSGADNPWSKEGWNLTKQGQVVREKGNAEAERLAKAVGSHLGAIRPKA